VHRVVLIVEQQSPRQRSERPARFVHQKVGRRKVPIMTVRRSKGAVERTVRDARQTQGERRDARFCYDPRLDCGKSVKPALGS
jgi:hypothetical protein